MSRTGFPLSADNFEYVREGLLGAILNCVRELIDEPCSDQPNPGQAARARAFIRQLEQLDALDEVGPLVIDLLERRVVDPRDHCPAQVYVTVKGRWAHVPSTSLTYTGVADAPDPADATTLIGTGRITGTMLDQCYASGGEPQPTDVDMEADVRVRRLDDETVLISFAPTGGAFLSRCSPIPCL